MRRIRSQLTYANLMSTLAVVLVIGGGTAYAANTVFSSDIVDGQVRTADIGDLEVRAADVAANSLGSAKIADGSVKNADLSTGASSSNTIADGGVQGIDVANDSLKGADVDEATLGQVSSARLGGIGRSVEANDCDPESGLFVACAFTELDVPPPGARALVLGDVSARTDAGEDFGIGDCQIHVDRLGGPLPGTRRTFKINDADDPDVGALVGVTPSLSPGLTAFGVTCQDASGVTGGIRYLDIGVSVVLISDN